MALSFEAFLYGMRQLESGGNYKAVGPVTKNGDRAYGKYQIMGSNVVRWAKQYLGRTITLEQYRNSEALQDELSEAVLRSYYNKYGADGAAAMWFSGSANPNSNASDGYLTVKQYVAKMNQKAQGYSGQQSSGGGGGGTPTIDRSVLAEQYGFMESLFNSIPELKTLFNKAVAGSWSADKFQAALRNTNWWKTHSDKEREYINKKLSDPATSNAEWTATRHKLQDMAAQLGVVGMSQSDMDALTYNMLALGWNDSQIKFQLGNLLTFSPEGGLAGAGGQFQMNMSNMAWSNGVKLDQDWYRIYYQGILRGTTTMEQAQQDIRNKAAALFPGFKDQIMAGMNVADIASPYLQGMSSILEINPADVDLFDPTIKSALNYKDKDGNTGAKPLWQFEVEMRQDPRWVKTANAREGLFGVAHKVAQDMGVLY